MTETMTFYKVVNNATGQFMTAGGGWAKTGKTWESMGRLKNALVSAGFYSTYDREWSRELPPPSWEIIEVIVRHDEGNRTKVVDLVTRERRMKELSAKYGSNFSELVRRIEDQGQVDQFQWVLMASSRWDYTTQSHSGDLGEMLDIVKGLKLRQNRDFKKSTSHGDRGAVAFATKMDAMRVRLAMSGQVQGIDIKEYVETDLDTEDSGALSR